MNRKGTVLGVGLLATLLAGATVADTVRLTDGDILHGTILSMDAKQVKLQTKVLGTLTIGRDQVQMMAFGEAPLEAPSAAHEKGAGAKTPSAGNSFDKYLKSQGINPKAFAEHGGIPIGQPPAGAGQGAAAGTPQDAVAQLKGLDPGLTKQLQQTFPLMAAPPVQKYFKDTVGGLITGKINLQDLRKQAIAVRKQIDDLDKDLGPEAKAALAPYSSILDHFIRETAPPAQASPNTAAKPGTPAAKPGAATGIKPGLGPLPRSGR